MIDEKKRDPPSDDDLLEVGELETPSHGGSSGGDLQREIGSLDEENTATGADPQATSVQKGQKPRDGDEPNLPNRDQAGGGPDKVSPKRTG